MDLNLIPEEEDEAQQEEQAHQGDAIDLNLIPEEEDEAQQEEQAHQGDAIDLNLIPEEEDEDIELNWFPEEEEAQDAQEDAEVQEAQEAQEDAEVQEAQEADGHGNPRGKDMTDKERHGVYFSLRVIELRDGQVHVYDKVRIATMLNVNLRTVTRIWNLAKRQLATGQEVDVSSKKNKSGRKRKGLDLSRIATIPLNNRSRIRSLARCLGVPRSTLHDRFQLQELKRITSTIKPTLKPQNKIARLKFCLSMMDERWISSPWPRFKPMTNMVHIDEKWYDMTRVKSSYYVLPGEEEPNRTMHNTHSIGKVMFLTAVAKPRYNEDGEMTFDGKLGIWPFVVQTEAQRTSQNRDRGTIELKPVKVTRPMCRDYLINKVIPTIQEKWPDGDEDTTIFIQQDNATPHVLPNDAGFLEAVAQTDLDIRLLQQPPNSPELSVLDLCFHCSLQSLTDCRAPMNIQELVHGVEEEFENYNAHKLFKSFMTLQAVMVEVMKDQGGNNYKMPHLHKECLQNAGEEIIGVYCSPELITDTKAIIEQGND
ncbi:uncharacterized protein [Aegilops tauschii subsp. strangulata]|nr:uncharacterized protein LOC109783189 isoform X1 [Aegilops tauschii subsp. strangulata]